VYVKIPFGKGCGFVQFTTRASAEAAFALHSTYIGNQRVRLSWGRSSNGGGAVGGMVLGASMAGPKSPTSLSSAYPYPSGYGSYGASGYGFSSAFSPAAGNGNGSYATTASAPSSYHDSYAASAQSSYAGHHHATAAVHHAGHHHHHSASPSSGAPLHLGVGHHRHLHHLHHHAASAAATTPSMAIPTAAGAASSPQVHTPSSYKFYHSTSSSLAIPASKSRAAAAAAATGGGSSSSSPYQLSPVDFTSPLDVEADNSSYALRAESDSASNIWSGADDTEMLLSLAASIHTLDFSGEPEHDDASDADAASSAHGSSSSAGNLGRFIPMFAS